MSKPDSSGAAISYGKADLDELGAIHKATPTVQEVAAAVGVPTRIEPNPQTGRPEVVADLGTMDRSKIGVLRECMNPSWKMDTQRQMNLTANRPTETLKYPNGEKRKVWSAVSEGVARQSGAVAKWSGKATRIYRDGKWYRRDGNRWLEDEFECMTRPLLKGERKAPAGYVH